MLLLMIFISLYLMINSYFVESQINVLIYLWALSQMIQMLRFSIYLYFTSRMEMLHSWLCFRDWVDDTFEPHLKEKELSDSIWIWVHLQRASYDNYTQHLLTSVFCLFFLQSKLQHIAPLYSKGSFVFRWSQQEDSEKLTQVPILFPYAFAQEVVYCDMKAVQLDGLRNGSCHKIFGLYCVELYLQVRNFQLLFKTLLKFTIKISHINHHTVWKLFHFNYMNWPELT